MRNKILILPFLFLTLWAPAEVQAGRGLTPVENMAVQSGGRIKPFSSLAREIVLFVTGRETWEGKEAAAVMLDWMARPSEWENKRFLPVSDPLLRKTLKFTEKRVSPKELGASPEFIHLVQEAQSREEAKETLLPAEKKISELYQKFNLFYSSCEGRTWTVLPDPARPEARWRSVDMIASDESLKPVSAAFNHLLDAYRAGNDDEIARAAAAFTGLLGRPASIGAEIHYNRLRPFRWAWHLYLPALILFLINLPAPRRLLLAGGYALTAAAFVFHTYGFVLRCWIAGRPPVSNMYESIIWVSWAVVFFSAILFFFYRSAILGIASTAVAALGLVLADSFPAMLDPSIGPLVPVLRNNFWLTVHVLTITLSYGAFALALGLGHLSLFAHAFRTDSEMLLRNLTEFLYRAIQIGVVLLASGTILGGVWANYSWGRFWGWDPKETWALIALLGYLALLHSRFTGWVGPFGLAAGAVVAFLGVLMAWYGVNYVLAAGLHSYGFGGGGLPYVGAFVLMDLLLVAALAWLYRRKSAVSKLS